MFISGEDPIEDLRILGVVSVPGGGTKTIAKLHRSETTEIVKIIAHLTTTFDRAKARIDATAEDDADARIAWEEFYRGETERMRIWLTEHHQWLMQRQRLDLVLERHQTQPFN